MNKEEDIMALDKELLSILACPKCKSKVRLSEDAGCLICDKCRLSYPVKDDIPVMLVDEAVPV